MTTTVIHTATFDDLTTYSVVSAETAREFTADMPKALIAKHGNFEVTSVKAKVDTEENPLFLWKFSWDCGRMGSIESVFPASQEELNTIIGEDIYFGEILGKHSDIHGKLDAEDFTLISSHPVEVLQFVTNIGSTGHNPFDYLEEE